jgi:hypothetical protein
MRNAQPFTTINDNSIACHSISRACNANFAHFCIQIKNEEVPCRYITRSLLPARPKDEWVADVKSRYEAMVGVTSEDAQLQFLNIMRCLPYGNSVFFAAKLLEDPTGLLPSSLALGINKRGIHFFRQNPKGYLYSAGLEDIMQFGSSAQVCPSLTSRRSRLWCLFHVMIDFTRGNTDLIISSCKRTEPYCCTADGIQSLTGCCGMSEAECLIL